MNQPLRVRGADWNEGLIVVPPLAGSANALIEQCEHVALKQYGDDDGQRKDHLIELLKVKLREVMHVPEGV